MSVNKFKDWEAQRERPVSTAADLVEYVSYAAPGLIAAGNDPGKVYSGLYQNLYTAGRKRGLFTAQNDEQAQQEFNTFTSLPLHDETRDLELVAADLEQRDPNRVTDAERLRNLAAAARSGQADEQELAEVRSTLASPANVQAARTKYATDNKLSFIDYPTADGKRRVWVNPDQTVTKDRATFYTDAQRNAGLIDPRYADVADQLNVVGPNGYTGWQAERISEAAKLFDDRFRGTVDFDEIREAAQESVEDVGAAEQAVEARPYQKEIQEELAPTAPQMIVGGLGPVIPFSEPKRTDKEAYGATALELAGNLYDRLPADDPIRTEYGREEFVKGAADTTIAGLETATNFKDPAKNFVTLPGSGAKIPLAAAALLPEEQFKEGAKKAGLNGAELKAADSLRKQHFARNYTQIDSALHEYDSKYADWIAENADKYENPIDMVRSYVDQLDPAEAGSTWLKAKGLLRSVPEAFEIAFQGLGLGLSGAVGWDTGYNMFEDQLVAGAQRERDRNMILGYMGNEPGVFYEATRTFVPVVADLLIARGAGTATRATAGAAARALPAEATRSASNFFSGAIKNGIDDALSAETKTMVGRYLAPRVKALQETGVTNPRKIFAAVRRDVRADLPRLVSYGAATASQYTTAFTRSATGSYANTIINARAELNEDGSRKYTDEEVRQMAVTDGLVSGFITVGTMGAMHRVFGPGADATTFERFNIGQLKRYSDDVAQGLRGLGGPSGGDELYNTVRSVAKEMVRSNYKNVGRQAFGEGVEEFIDEFTQSVVLDMINNRELELGEALQNGFKAFVLGGVMGGGVSAVTSGAVPLKAFRRDLEAEVEQDYRTGTAQQIQLEVLNRTVARLEETGAAPQTAEVLKTLGRRAARSARPVQDLLTPQDIRDSIVERIELVEPADPPPAAPATPPAPTQQGVPTRLAAKLAEELGLTRAELLAIEPSGEKNGRPQITPNDVRAYQQYKVEAAPPPAPEPVEPVKTAEQRTFRELEGRVVILNGERGRVRLDPRTGGVLLDPETGTAPFEITPNPDMVSGEFEGFNAVIDEPARVSPRRQRRAFVEGPARQQVETAEVLPDGTVRYGRTDYALPRQPLFANVRTDDAGQVESLHVRVFAGDGRATWVFVADEDAQRLQEAYDATEPGQFSNALRSAIRTDVSRNQAAQRGRQQQKAQRRKQKQRANQAPPISERTERVVVQNADLRLDSMRTGKMAPELRTELRRVGDLLGLNENTIADDNELFEMIAGEVAAGMDFSDLATEQDLDQVLAQVVQGKLERPATPLEQTMSRLMAGEPPTTLFEFAIQNHIASRSPGKVAAIAKRRVANAEQIRRHNLSNNTPLRDMIGSIARSAKSQLHRATAKLLLETGIPNTRVVFVRLPNNLDTAAAYLPNSNTVVVNLASDNGGGPVDALLHELAGHANLDEAISNPQTDNARLVRDQLFELRRELVERAKAFYGATMPADLRYALEGRTTDSEPFSEVQATREMVAHFKASETFHKQLAAMDETGKRSFVQKFIDLIAKLLGGPSPSATVKQVAESIGNLERALRESGSPNPYGRSVGRVSASRAAFLQDQKMGPLAGVPNPHQRTDFAWTKHQIDSLPFQPIKGDRVREIIANETWGMLTGENPNNTVVSEQDNADFNEQAVQWLRDRGYDPLRIIGRYDGKGENSFLVPGLTYEDAVAAANDLQQESVAIDTGIVYQDGSFHARVGEDLETPVQPEDNFFSATLDEDGNVVTVRVHYDWEVRTPAPETTPPLTDPQAQQVAGLQTEHPTVQSPSYSRAITFDGRLVIVNPEAAAAAYGDLPPALAAQAQQYDLAVAYAAYAAEKDAPGVAEKIGYTPQQLIEELATDQAAPETLQDLQQDPNGAAFILRSYYELTAQSPAAHAQLAEASTRLAAVYRRLVNNNETPAELQADPNNPTANAGLLLPDEPLPIMSVPRPVLTVDPAEVKSRTLAGTRVGTRRPTGKKRTEQGTDPASTIDLQTVRDRNPQLYRRMALQLLELDIVAAKHPRLAKFVADERAKIAEAEKIVEEQKDKVGRYSETLKRIIAEDRGLLNRKGLPQTSKVKADLFAEYESNPEAAFTKDAEGDTIRKEALQRFKDQLALRGPEDTKLDELQEVLKKARSAYGDTLTNVAAGETNRNTAALLARTADDIIETLVQEGGNNLRALFELVPDDIRDIAKLWYDGANIIAQQYAAKYGVSLEKASAVLAVFSPQKDWFQNVALAQRTMEIWVEEQNYRWDEAMTAQYLLRAGQPKPTLKEDGTISWPKGVVPAKDPDAEDGFLRDENGDIVFAKLPPGLREKLENAAKNNLPQLQGKALAELNPEQQAWFVRMREETKYPTREYPGIRPDGVFLESATKPNTDAKIKLAWGGYSTVAKALEILKAADENVMGVIDEQLGDAHKVRSFYNNIVAPGAPEGDVTMDTHAIAAVLWQALSGSSRPVAQNFGSGGSSSKDANLGVAGMYPVYGEVYRRLAAELTQEGPEFLAREVQSVTWEVVRLLFSPEIKRDKKAKQEFDAAWADYRNGVTDADTARVRVFAAALRGRNLYVARDQPDNKAEVGVGVLAWEDEVKQPVDPATVSRSRAVLSGPPETATEVRAHFAAKFGAMGRKLGVNVVPNYGGYTAQYVVQGQQGKRYIEFNPTQFVGEPVEALDAVMREEFIHAVVHQAVMRANPGADPTEALRDFELELYNSMDPAERKLTKQVYTSAKSKQTVATEFLRMGIQKMLYGTVTEAELRRKSYKRIQALVQDAVDWFDQSRQVTHLTRQVYNDAVRMLQVADPEFKKGRVGGRTISRSRAVLPSVDLNRHAELEAKFNAGTITPEETAEAEALVEKVAKVAGYNTTPLFHGSPVEDIDIFRTDSGYEFGPAVYLTPTYSRAKGYSQGGRVYKLFARWSNPALGSFKSPEQYRSNPQFEYLDGITNDEKNATARSLGYDSVVKFWSFEGDGDPVEIAVFDPNQVKSAEPFTGVPLDQRFDVASSDIRYSRALVSPQQDADYLAAVERGDMEAAQRMVDEMAAAAGFNAQPLWHGSDKKFWQFEQKKGSVQVLFSSFEVDRAGFFFTPEQRLAKRFGSNVRKFYLRASNPADFSPGSTKYREKYNYNLSDAEVRLIEEKGYTPQFFRRDAWEWFDADEDFGGGKQLVEDLKDLGYDGAIIEEPLSSSEQRELDIDGSPNTTIVFDATQIKSADAVTRDEAGNIVPLSQRFQTTSPDIRYSRAVFGVAPSVENAYAVGVGDLFVNQEGDWDSGKWWAVALRPGGRVDPRVNEIRNYQQQALNLAQARLKEFSDKFNKALKSEEGAFDPNDLELALGSTEPTVSAAARKAAEDKRAAAYAAADESYSSGPATKKYREALAAERARYAETGDKAAFTRGVETARELLRNSPEKLARAAAYAAADAAYGQEINEARMASVAPARAAARAAQARLQTTAPQLAEAAIELRAAVDELSIQLRDELAMDDPMRVVIDGNLGVYLTRRYRIHREEGYAQRLLDDPEFAAKREKGRKYFEAQWIASTFKEKRADLAYEPYSDAELMNLVRAEAASTDAGGRALAEYISQHSDAPTTPTAAAADRTNLERFMLKQEVPAELRELLGEYTNPVTNALSTYAELIRFLGTQRALNQYVQTGAQSGWLVPAADVAADPEKFRGYRQVLNTTKTRGGNPLSDYFAAPEAAQYLEEMFAPYTPQRANVMQAASNAAAWLTGMSMAASTLSSIGFYVRNTVGNGFFAWMNGFVPSIDNIRTSWEGLQQIYGRQGIDELAAKAYAYGLAGNNLRQNLLKNLLQGVVDNPNQAAERLVQVTEEFGQPQGAFNKGKSWAQLPAEKLSALSAAIDTQYKLAYWAHEMDVLRKANAKRAEPWTEQQIEQMAARTVNRTSQGTQRVLPIVKDFNRSGWGTIFNSFFRFVGEMARMPVEIGAVAIEEINSGNPVLASRGRARLIGLSSAVTASLVVPGLLKSLYQIGDDEEEAFRMGLPNYSKDSNLLLIRGDEGQIHSWDLTFLNPLSPWTDPVARGLHHVVYDRPTEAALALLKGLGGTLLSPQILTDAMIQLQNNRDDYNNPIWLQDDGVGEKIAKGASYLAANAFRLRTPSKVIQAITSYADGTVYDEEAQIMRPIQTIGAEFLPVRRRSSDPKRVARTVFARLNARSSELKADTSRKLTRTQDLSRQQVFDLLDTHERKMANINRAMRQATRGLQKLGVNETDLRAIAKESNVSVRRFNLANLGQFERYTLSDEQFANVRRYLQEYGQAEQRISHIREWQGLRARLNSID